MGILLDGATQWVTCGLGVNIANTRPISFAALYDSTNLRTAGAYGTLMSQGRTWYGSGTGGWTMLVEAAAAPRLEIGWNVTGAAGGSVHSTFTTTPNTGVHLAAGVIYDNGANSRFRFFHYRYSNATFQGEAAAIPSSATDFNVGSSAAGDPFLIGAGWTGAATEDWFPGHILWAACFSHDLGLGGGTTLATLPQMAALIFQGPWAMADRCLGFWSFQTGSAVDLSRAATRRNGTLTGGPSYSYTRALVVTGTPPGGVVRIIRGAAAGGGPVTVDLTSVPASASGTAVNPTVQQGSLTLTLAAAPASAVGTAVTPSVRQGSLSLSLTAAPASAAGTAVTPSLTLGSVTANLTALPASATGTAVNPTVTIVGGGLTVDVSGAPATASGTAVSPSVRQGSLTINATAVPASAAGTAVTPTVTIGGGGLTVNVAAAPASAAGTAVSPSVRLGSVTVTLAAAPAAAVGTAVTPSVRQGSLMLTLAALPAAATGTALSPSVTLVDAFEYPLASVSVIARPGASSTAPRPGAGSSASRPGATSTATRPGASSLATRPASTSEL